MSEEKNLEIFKNMIDTMDDAIVVDERYGVSESKIKHLPAKMEEKYPDLYAEYKEKIEIKKQEKRRNGNKKGYVNELQKDKYIMIANAMIDGHLTYEEASERFNISSSTIAENIKKFCDNETRSKLRDIGEENKRESFNNKTPKF